LDKRHLKRLRIPSFWRVPKKHAKWVVKPRPGPHKQLESIPLLVVMRDVLGVTDKGKEAKAIIKMGEVLVDGKPRKDHKYPAGLMDVVSIPKLNANYRIVPAYNGLIFIGIEPSETGKKICKIVNKRSVKKKNVKGEKEKGHNFQLNLHDGRNILVGPKEGEGYKVGDSILIDLPSQKVLNHLRLEKGALALVVKGKNMGVTGKIEDIIVTKTKEPVKIICKVGSEKIEVIKDYVVVIGKDNPVIKLAEQ
jgi:small subunit ribosomal protein S4e